MVQMISHGLVSGALFLCVGVLYDRMHSRQIADYGGVINTMPMFAAFMVLFALANAGLPGTSGFVGEFLVILAAFKANFWYAFLAATHADPRRGLHAVAGQARRVRAGRQRPRRPVAGRERPRVPRAGRARHRRAALGLWPAPLLDVDAADPRATGAADDDDEALTMNPASITRLDLVARGARDVPARGDLRRAARRPVPARRATRWITFVLSLLTLAGAAWITAATGFTERTVGWHGTYVADPLSTPAQDRGLRRRRRRVPVWPRLPAGCGAS